MTRFQRYYVNHANLTEVAKDDILGHFGDLNQIQRTFPTWKNQLTIVVSSDKADEVMHLITNGQYVKVPEPEAAVAVAGTHPVCIFDAKFKLLEFLPNTKLDNINCVRFAMLKANNKPSSKGVKTMALVKISLDRPTQHDVTKLAAEVDAERLKAVLASWPEEFTRHLMMPQFTKETKGEPPLSHVPPTAPTNVAADTPEQKNVPPKTENQQTVSVNQTEAAAMQLATLTETVMAMQNRMNQIDLNAGTDALMVQSGAKTTDATPSDNSKVILSKTVFSVPRVDLDATSSMADALDSLVSMTRLIDDRSHKSLILQFLSTNGLTDIIPDLEDSQLNSIKAFQSAMLDRYGAADPVSEFNAIIQRNLEDPATLLHRIQRAWRRVKAMKDDDKIPESELRIIRDRYIKSLKSKGLRTKLRIWDTPYEDLVRVSRDYINAIKIEDFEPSTSANAMVAFDSCRYCGLAHSSDVCRSNPKQKTSWNKKQKNNRPASRSPARIIPDNIGNDNRYQPVERSRKKLPDQPRSHNHQNTRRSRERSRSRDYPRSYGRPLSPIRERQRERSRSPYRSQKQVRFSDQQDRRGNYRYGGKGKRGWNNAKQDKPWAKFYNNQSTQAYLAMNDFDDEFEHPFQSGVEDCCYGYRR